MAARYDISIPALTHRDGIFIHRLAVRDRYRLRTLPGPGYYYRSAQQLLYSLRLARYLKATGLDEQADIIEFAEVNAEGYFYARAPRTAIAVRCHTPSSVLARYYHKAETPYDTRIISHCEHQMIRHISTRLAPSHDMANVIAAACAVPHETIQVVPNPVSFPELENLDPLDENRRAQPVILFVGRLERAKGVYVLSEAIPLVLQHIPNAQFVFVGGDRVNEQRGSTRAQLKQLLAQRGVDAQVHFPGEVAQADLPKWYAQADVCVVPSLLYESFSYTTAHAMLAARPVVASHIGGIPETLNEDECGIVVEPGSARALAEGIVCLLQEPKRAADKGNAGRARVKTHFHPLKIAAQTLAAYRRAGHVSAD